MVTILADLNKNKLDVFVRGAENEIAKNLMETNYSEENPKNHRGYKNPRNRNTKTTTRME